MGNEMYIEIDDLVQSCLESNYVINIQKLLDTKNYDAVVKGLNEHPITINEYIKTLYDNGERRKLFQYSIDNGYVTIARRLMDEDRGKYANNNSPYNKYPHLPEDESWSINKKFKAYSKKPITDPNEVRQKIIDDISSKVDKERVTKDLNYDYFIDLLNKGNKEMLVIKLCVRLEAILSYDYHLQGTFEEMLKTYVNRYPNASCNEIFQKLRKYRNNIVHPSEKGEEMTDKELKSAIDYVFKLG